MDDLGSEYGDAEVRASARSEWRRVYFEDPRKQGAEQATLGRALFELREFEKCAQRLGGRTAGHPIASFVRYAAVLASIEERAEAARLEGSGGGREGASRELEKLERELVSLGEAKDGFHWYLLGVVLKRSKKEEAARGALERALSLVPVLWSAWVELAGLGQG